MTRASFSPPPQKKPAHLVFNATDQLLVPASSSLNTFMGSSFTIDYVISTTENFGGSFSTEAISKYNPSTIRGLYNDIYFIGGVDAAVDVNIDQGTGNYAYYEAFLPTATYLNGLPHHIEMDIDYSVPSIKIFFDGVLCPDSFALDWHITLPWTFNESIPLGVFTVQPEYSGADSYKFPGNVYWVRISNCVRHSSNFTPPSYHICPAPDNNTILRLALDEGSGTTAKDTSKNRNNGTISGATWELD